MPAPRARSSAPTCCREIFVALQTRQTRGVVAIADLYRRATGLQPMGESVSSKSTIDALLLGCIPVLFHDGQRQHWPWHVGSWFARVGPPRRRRRRGGELTRSQSFGGSCAVSGSRCAARSPSTRTASIIGRAAGARGGHAGERARRLWDRDAGASTDGGDGGRRVQGGQRVLRRCPSTCSCVCPSRCRRLRRRRRRQRLFLPRRPAHSPLYIRDETQEESPHAQRALPLRGRPGARAQPWLPRSPVGNRRGGVARRRKRSGR